VINADIGGVAATVQFAVLAPGFVGLYQVNLTIPSGVTVGDNYLDILRTGFLFVRSSDIDLGQRRRFFGVAQWRTPAVDGQ